MDCFFPLGLIITLVFLIFEFFPMSSLGTKPQLFYVTMVEFAVSIEGSLFFKLSQCFFGEG